MRTHCITRQPCKILPKRGNAPYPNSNRRPPPRRSKSPRPSVGQTLENAREILRRDIPVPLSNPTPETPVHCTAGDTVFEVDPVTHLRLVTNPLPANTQSAMLFAFIASVPDDHAPVVLLAQERRIDAPLIPEQGPDLIGGVVTMDDATFTTLLSLHSGVSATSRFNCRGLLDTGSPQSFIHQGAFDQMVASGAADASCVRSTTELGAVSDPDSCSARTNRPE